MGFADHALKHAIGNRDSPRCNHILSCSSGRMTRYAKVTRETTEAVSRFQVLAVSVGFRNRAEP